MSNLSQSLLESYRLRNEQAQQMIIPRNQLHHHQSLAPYQMPEAIYYMKALSFADLILIPISIFSQVEIDYNHALKYIAFSLMFVSATFIIYFAFIGVKRGYIGAYWGALWIHYGLGIIASVFIINAKSSTACLWLLLSSAVIMTILEIIIKRSLVWLIFVLIINTPCVGVLAQFVIRKDDNQPIHLNFGLFMSANVICFVALIFLSCLLRKWSTLNLVQRLFLSCSFYLLLLAIMACAAGCSDYAGFPWPIYTIMNHIAYIAIVRYFFKIKDPKYKLLKVPRLISNTNINRSDVESIEKLYQVSLCLLCKQEDYVETSRQSVIGRPLNECICCLSQQSTFCYDNCKHACIGALCALNWLQKNVTKCPICRTESMILLRVQRVDPIEFNVIGKYKIGKD